MITRKGLATTIKCGRNGVGTTSVKGDCNQNHARLIIQELSSKSNVKIGTSPDDGDIKNLPSVTIEFYDVQSVDAYISILEGIKKAMTQRMLFYMAC